MRELRHKGGDGGLARGSVSLSVAETGLGHLSPGSSDHAPSRVPCHPWSASLLLSHAQLIFAELLREPQLGHCTVISYCKESKQGGKAQPLLY